jgi:predicted nuclease of predicted toxin-antitoxin system
MKFIVDAQLPKRLARWLAARGHDVLHTLDLPEQNRTQDAAITALACRGAAYRRDQGLRFRRFLPAATS